MTEQARTWVPREERRVSPTPTEIPPHPDEGHLPPCEAGIASDRPCPRQAVWHYGYSYYCDEHTAWMQASEDYNEADLAVYHAKRFLWKAQVEGLDRLEHHITQGLRELEEERLKAGEAEKQAARKAGVVEEGEGR